MTVARRSLARLFEVVTAHFAPSWGEAHGPTRCRQRRRRVREMHSPQTAAGVYRHRLGALRKGGCNATAGLGVWRC